jgi:basic amino acid/polyamine antiporter, APA family
MLNRGIKKWDLVLLTINCIIGAGIFGLPSKVFKLSGVYSIAAIFVCALAVLVFILCFAEVSTQFDKTGGPYIYTLEAFGRFPAFCMAWLLLLRGVFGYATLVNLLVIYLSFFLPWTVEPVARISLIFIITAFLGYVNHIGVKNATRLNNVLTIAKLLPLIIFIIAGLFFLKPAAFVPTASSNFNAFSGSVLLFIFAFGGFEGVLINSGEIHDIKKTLPFALIASALVVTLFYCLIQVVCIGNLPNLAGSDKPLAEAAVLFLGKNGGYLMAAGAVLSILGTLNAGALIGSRLPFALSEEDHFPKLFSYIHPKRLTPTWSLVFFLVSVAITSIFQSFLSALSITVIIRVLSYLIICITLIKLRRDKKDKPKHFKLRFGYFFAITGILLSVWLLTTITITDIKNVSVCLLAGLVVYAVMKLAVKKFHLKK